MLLREDQLWINWIVLMKDQFYHWKMNCITERSTVLLAGQLHYWKVNCIIGRACRLEDHSETIRSIVYTTAKMGAKLYRPTGLLFKFSINSALFWIGRVWGTFHTIAPRAYFAAWDCSYQCLWLKNWIASGKETIVELQNRTQQPLPGNLRAEPIRLPQRVVPFQVFPGTAWCIELSFIFCLVE